MKLDEKTRKALAYYVIMKHPIVFRDFYLPTAWGKPFKTRYYQFSYVLSDECLVVGGRSFGKSIHLEADMLQNCINDYNEDSLLTTFRRMHVKDRFEKVILYFTRIPYLTKFLKGRGEVSTKESITRTPFYDIHLRNGHSLKGISVGDDPLAVAIQGTHPTRRYIDEMQMYPSEAWVKFQSTRDPRGAKDKFYGCADGRRNTPYYEADNKLKKFKNKKFHVPRLMEQYFNQEDKFNLIQTFGSENANEYLQQVLAQWGEPEWGVWDEQIIRHCIDKTEEKKGSGILANHIRFITISAKDYVNASASILLQGLKIPTNVTETILAIDAGYAEPTVILPFMRINHKWHLYNIIELRDRMIPDDQTELIDYIADQYHAMTIPIDCTSADGRSVASSLQNPKRKEFEGKNYDKRVVWVEFNKYFEVGKKMDEKDPQKEIAIKEKVKDKTTTLLRQMFANQDFFLYYAEDLLAQFNAESQSRNVIGALIIKTPSWVHIPEAFRCFAAAYFQKYIMDRPEDLEEPIGNMAHAEQIDLGFQVFTYDENDDQDLPIELR